MQSPAPSDINSLYFLDPLSWRSMETLPVTAVSYTLIVSFHPVFPWAFSQGLISAKKAIP